MEEGASARGCMGGAVIPDRQAILRELEANPLWDVLVIGGGATGLGAAVEAASRGYRTLLLERDDFAKGTSSRSTKLVHGGVRYLEQFNVRLVLDALKERGHMLRNAPHLVHRLPFVVPVYGWAGLPYYGMGLKVYERMSGRLSLGPSQMLSRGETVERLPTIQGDGLKGGVLYFDGQFDDARFAISLLRTLFDQGGTALNHAGVVRLVQQDGRIQGAVARDGETGQEWEIRAKVVVNATGVFAEEVLAMDGAAGDRLLAISQGTHFVLPRSFLPGASALMVPKTSDGRVLFAIPWHEHLVVGTTDEPMPGSSAEPRSTAPEREFLVDHIRKYLGKTVGAGEILSVWSGLRPLAASGNASTAKISRDHKVVVSKSGLVTVTGGKWTTYRRMGEDAIDHAARLAALPPSPSRTLDLHLHGWVENSATLEREGTQAVYGADLQAVQAVCAESPELGELLHPRLPYRKGEVVWAARHEMARTVEDVLARRTRALFLDARAAIEAAPTVAGLLAHELARDAASQQEDLRVFEALAAGYVYVA